jgi:hypothetical protein
MYAMAYVLAVFLKLMVKLAIWSIAITAVLIAFVVYTVAKAITGLANHRTITVPENPEGEDKIP